jgi:RHS repeat-associated protein
MTYAYDKTNHRRFQYENDGTITTWTYDAAYQLSNERRAGGPLGTSFNITHTWDSTGNRLARNADGVLTTYTYSNANRLQKEVTGSAITTYTYDAAGNRTAKQDSSGYVYYDWDAAGRMSSAEPPGRLTQYLYNADGQRMGKQFYDSSIQGFLYDFNNLLHETDNLGGAIEKTYTTGIDDEYGDVFSEGGNELYHFYDAQQCTNALLDDSGIVVSRFKYEAFGQARSSGALPSEGWATLTADQWSAMTADDWANLPVLPGGAMDGFGGFGQKQYYLDAETELYLLGGGSGGRYYDDKTAHFMSEDPIRHDAGDANLLRYVANDPINRIDPSGLIDGATYVPVGGLGTGFGPIPLDDRRHRMLDAFPAPRAPAKPQRTAAEVLVQSNDEYNTFWNLASAHSKSVYTIYVQKVEWYRKRGITVVGDSQQFRQTLDGAPSPRPSGLAHTEMRAAAPLTPQQQRDQDFINMVERKVSENREGDIVEYNRYLRLIGGPAETWRQVQDAASSALFALWTIKNSPYRSPKDYALPPGAVRPRIPEEIKPPPAEVEPVESAPIADPGRLLPAPPRPTPAESEARVARDFGWEGQQSYKQGLRVGYGEEGSVRPDITNPTSNIHLDAKNYDLSSPGNRANLYNRIKAQATNRALNLPKGASQGIVIDVRGQSVDPAVLRRIPVNIETATGGIIPRSRVVFLMDSGYAIP